MGKNTWRAHVKLQLELSADHGDMAESKANIESVPSSVDEQAQAHGCLDCIQWNSPVKIYSSCSDGNGIDCEDIVGDSKASDYAVVGGYLRGKASCVDKTRVEDGELNGQGCGW